MQAVSAGIVAVFTAVLVYVARSTLKATKTAAEAAKKSADVAEKSVSNIERPFVLIQKIEPKIRPMRGHEPQPSYFCSATCKCLSQKLRKVTSASPGG